MSLSGAFAPPCAPWVVYEDDDVIVVDKPRGVPSQSARPEDPDDVMHRLRAWLAERDGSEAYLGSHQRLDQATSGLLLYAKRREANKALATQFEGRAVLKRYLAIVHDPEGRTLRPRTLRHKLERRDGRVRTTRGKGKTAVTHVRRVKGAPLPDGHVWIEAEIETGRTHQIRAQLAELGCPIVGDPWYGGAEASRLMLHAHHLELRHPRTGKPLRLRADPPAEMARFGEPDWDEGVVHALLGDAASRRYALGRAHARGWTTVFRWVHGVADALPGVFVDVYGEYAVLQLYDDALAHEAALAAALMKHGVAGVYVKRRPKQANEVVDTRTETLAPARPIAGDAAPEPFEVFELGVPYRVRLGDGLSTGLFVDQRDNRGRTRELAEGRRVLNLFAYTGPFTVAAVAGGARETVTVDVAAPALAWAEAQVRALPRAGAGEHRFVRDDVFEYLARLARRGERFDLILCDPPTYSSAKKGRGKKRRWKSGAQYAELARMVAQVAAPGADVLFCSNDARTTLRRFEGHVRNGVAEAGFAEARLKARRAPMDFPETPGTPARAKTVWVSL